MGTVDQYSDALSILGLKGKSFAEMTDIEKGILVDLTDLREKNRLREKSGAGAMVYKSQQSEPQETFEQGPALVVRGPSHRPVVHPWYLGPPNVQQQTGFYYRQDPTCKSVARSSVGLDPNTTTREREAMNASHRVISPALAARPWLR